MRKSVLYHLLSLDGVSEEPGDWFFDVDAEVFDYLARVISTQDDIVMGRGTYEYWVDYWPSSDVEPFATFINTHPKHVLTSSPLTKPWTNTVATNEVATAYVAALRQGPGRDIGIHGSTSLARALIRERLVDELRLVVVPTVAGSGHRLFADDATLQRFDLTNVERTPGGTLLLDYTRRT